MEKISEMKNLVQTLNRYNDSYYNDNYNLVSDKEYDELHSKLQELEKETEVILSQSPTINVGCEIRSELPKVRHNHLMLSLDKTKSIDELREFCEKSPTVIMQKLDGLSVTLMYCDGKLVSAETRGHDGLTGEDITHNARVFSNVPLTINAKHRVVVDGEAIIDRDTFIRINDRLPDGEKYKNQRNLASGSVRQLDSKVTQKRNVRFIAWRMIEGSESNSFLDRMRELERYGFEVVECSVYTPYYLESIIIWLKQRAKDEGIPIDGIVVTYSDIKYGESLGMTEHHPKHSIAFKFYDEGERTTLRGVEWNTTRTGLVNPVAIFDTVWIDGTEVSRASLSNVSIIEELELGYGDQIEVIKANMIIPMVARNLTKSGTVEIPRACPSCGESLEIDDSSGRKMLRCTNENCPAILVDRYSHFVGKTGLDIKGLSDKTIRKMIEWGLICGNLYDIFNVDYYDILKLDGFSINSAKKLVSAIEAGRKCKLQNALVAIGIPEVGKSMAKLLAEKIYGFRNSSIEESPLLTFIQMCRQYFVWSRFNGIGDAIETEINCYVIKHIDDLTTLAKDYLIIEEPEIVNDSGVLNGKTFCITGGLELYKNRAELVSVIEDNGGKVVSSVSKNTDFLICNDKDSDSSKMKKARSLGIPILTELNLTRKYIR